MPVRVETARAFVPLLAPARYKGAYGGRGSGKSHFFAEQVVIRCYERATRVVCIREIQKSLEQSVKRLIEDKIAELGLSFAFRVLKTHIECPNGSLIIFVGMQNHTADSIKSLEGFDVAWFEEAQNASARSLGLLRPTIRKPGSELWASWNPSLATDPIDALLRGDECPEGAIVVEANYADNPWFPDVLRAEMEFDKRRDPERYAHVWMGKYQRNSEARVFRNWKIDEIEVPGDARPYYGGDWGFATDPTTLVRCYLVGERTLYVSDEAYMAECPIDETPALFAGSDDRLVPRWGNPRGFAGIPGAAAWPITADSARPETIDYMRKRGFNVTPARKGGGSVEEGVQFLKTFDIVVHPRCRHTVDELTLYSYKVDKMTEEVLPVLQDRNNHCIDALRYALEGVRRRSSVYSASEPTVVEEVKAIPSIWQRVAGLTISAKRVAAVWVAYDRQTDVVHVYDALSVPRGDLAVHAQAVRARGRWIPAVLAEPERASDREATERAAYEMTDLGVDLMSAPLDMAAAISEVQSRLATGRLRVARHLEDWFIEFRNFGRDEKGDIVEEQQDLMRATALICVSGLMVAKTEAKAASDRDGLDLADFHKPASATGY